MTLGSETSRSVEHFAAVVRRWWLLISIGTVIAVAFGAAVSLGSVTHFAADAEVLLSQPSQTLVPGDATALHRLAELQVTVARLASSDAVLEAAHDSGATTRPLDDLRDRVTASAVPNTLIIRIHTEFPTGPEAARVAAAVIQQLQPQLAVLGDTGPTSALVLQPVQAPVVTKVATNLPRTVLITFVLGFGFSILAAFALDRG